MADRSARAGRVVPALVAVTLMALSFAQRWGETTFDTKFDLTADPGGFLARTLHLWNPALSFGELQNQAYGYLFPQGSFFVLGELAGLPEWVTQRLWSGLVLVLAFEGARRLSRALDSGRNGAEWFAVMAGVAFALAPRLLGLAGVLSAEVLPTAVLPWVVLPLVKGLRGEMSPRLGGLLSGSAVLLMGGVNAVEDLAALPLPALVLLTSWRQPVARRLGQWWVLATTAACLWWFLPLLVLGRYSPPFLDYIETAAVTTDPLGWTNAVRGADHWVAFFNVGGQPWWPAAFDLARSPWLVAITALIAAVSLAGLFDRRMPLRGPLVLSASLGLVLLTLAHESVLASPLSDPVRTLLDGPLAPLRNVHKVDPLVRLPLALGFAHAVSLATTAAGALARRPHRAAPARQLTSALVAAGAVLLLLASAQPMFAGQLRKPGWTELPDAWVQATNWLGDRAEGRRTLVLPGSGFGQQTWGWTIDEPIQGLAKSPWVTRSQVPLVPGQTIRFLDSLQERVNDGRGSPALADALARAGIGYVLVRRDLDRFASDAPSPARVDQALRRSPGLTHAASFGTDQTGRPLIDVLEVDQEVSRVDVVPEEQLVSVAGGPEDVITLLESGQLGSRAPAIISGEVDREAPPDLVADGYRLRERQFGRLQDSLSQLLPSSAEFRVERKVHDYPGVRGVARVRAVYGDVRSVTASTSSGYADVLGPVRPELGPWSALDGESETYWRSAPLENPVGQWLEVRLAEPQPLPYVDVQAGVDPFSGVPVRRIEVRAGDQVSSHVVDPGSGHVRVPLSGEPVQQVRITVSRVLGNRSEGVVAIREVGLPGIRPRRTLEVPVQDGSGETGFAFRAQPHRRACVAGDGTQVCEPDAARPSEEASGLDRRFLTTSRGTWHVRGTVVARPGPATADLLRPLDGVRVKASSVLGDEPSVSGQFVYDGDPLTSWLSQRGARAPSLELRWDRPRVLTRLQVRGALLRSRAPTRAVLRAGDEVRTVSLGAGALGLFEPLRTDRLTITFPMEEGVAGAEDLPVGVGELVIDGLNGLQRPPLRDAPTGATCGLGPTLTVDGRQIRTRVRGSIADVLDGGELAMVPCGGNGRIELPAGQHDLRLPSTDSFAPVQLSLEPVGSGARARLPSRTAEIETWHSTERTVRVGPGARAVLKVPENVNGGWRATLDGRVLESLHVDGWQQGYRLPAGAGGLVRLSYVPDAAYRTSLSVGGIAALLLLVLTGLSWWRERAPDGVVRGTTPSLGGGYRAGLAGRLLILVVAWLAGGLAILSGVALGLLLNHRGGRLGVPDGLVLVGASGVAVFGVAAGVVLGAGWPVDREIIDAGTGIAIGILLSVLFSGSDPRPRRNPDG